MLQVNWAKDWLYLTSHTDAAVENGSVSQVNWSKGWLCTASRERLLSAANKLGERLALSLNSHTDTAVENGSVSQVYWAKGWLRTAVENGSSVLQVNWAKKVGSVNSHTDAAVETAS